MKLMVALATLYANSEVELVDIYKKRDELYEAYKKDLIASGSNFFQVPAARKRPAASTAISSSPAAPAASSAALEPAACCTPPRKTTKKAGSTAARSSFSCQPSDVWGFDEYASLF